MNLERRRRRGGCGRPMARWPCWPFRWFSISPFTPGLSSAVECDLSLSRPFPARLADDHRTFRRRPGLQHGVGLLLRSGPRRASFCRCAIWQKSTSNLIRGTPLLVQILIFFYVVADAFGVQNRFVRGCFDPSFFSGAYISEIIRAGIESVGRSQLESAKAIGLTRAADLSLRDFSAGPPPDPAAAGRAIRFAGQGLLAPVHHRSSRNSPRSRRTPTPSPTARWNATCRWRWAISS